jgi:hypothetical protein
LISAIFDLPFCNLINYLLLTAARFSTHLPLKRSAMPFASLEYSGAGLGRRRTDARPAAGKRLKQESQPTFRLVRIAAVEK